MPDDALVCLDGADPPWHKCIAVVARPWPVSLPGIRALRQLHRTKRTVTIGAVLSDSSVFVVDEDGHACEVARGAVRAPVRFVLNYSGWSVYELPVTGLVVAECTMDDGLIWVVTPQATPAPAGCRRSAQAGGRCWDGVEAAAPRTLGTVSSSPPRAEVLPSWPGAVQPPTRFELKKKFTELEFADGWVSFDVRGERTAVLSEYALAAYQAVRDLLDAVLQAGVVVTVERGVGGVLACSLTGLEALPAAFHKVERKHFVRRSCPDGRWVDVEELIRSRPGGGSGGLRDLLDITELGFGARTEAFLRLYDRRVPGSRAELMRGRGMIIPLAATDGGPIWQAWETVEAGHATYLFRPESDEHRQGLLAWAQNPDVALLEMLRDTGLRKELGYQRRVIHRGDESDPYSAWWAELCTCLGWQVRAR